jgi:type III secretion protein L
VSNKFFSLLHGDNVHIAPNQKVLPASAFSSLMSAEEILAAVKSDAIKYKEEVAIECEEIKEVARREGYDAGFQEWAEHILKMQNEINGLRKEYSKMLAPIALKAAQKIVGKAFEINNELVFDTVSNALKSVLQHKRITIYVNKSDIEVLEKNRGRLKDLFENIEALSIRERDDIKAGGCIIETEGGIINAQLENQWAVLERAFESLFKELSLKHEKNTVG